LVGEETADGKEEKKWNDVKAKNAQNRCEHVKGE